MITVSIAMAARSLRQRLIGDWFGPPGLLAEIVIGTALLVSIVELLGSVGALRRWPLVFASIASVAAARVLTARGRHESATRHDRAEPRVDLASVAVLAVTAPFVLAPWLQQTVDSLKLGMLEFDTLWYHMPFAARFAQDGWIIRPHHVGNPPDAFLPATSELFHTIGILAFSSDVLSPFLNLAWVGVFLLGAWCVGRPVGAGVATVSAAAVVLALPVVVASQAASAQSDIAGLALLTAAVAFVASDRERPRVAGISGVAAGLAIATKLTLIAPAFALAAGAVAMARPERRRALAVAWAAGLLATGTFWYLRNLAYTGNPFPWFGLHVGGITLPSTGPTIDCGYTTLADAVANTREFRQQVSPLLPRAFGPAWPLVLAAAGAGIAAGIATRRRTEVMLAIVALLAACAYVFTPATAGGDAARCFVYNTRFATPALTLSLFVLVLSLARYGRRYVLGCAAVLGVVVLLNSKQAFNTSFAGALVAVLVAVAAVMTVPRLRHSRRTLGLVVAAGLLLLALGGGWKLQQTYLDNRYAGRELEEPMAKIQRRLRATRDARIAVVGLLTHYPLYGAALSNRVEFPVVRRHYARFEEIATCREWVEALARRRYDYVVVVPRNRRDAAKIAWTRFQPSAREILSAPDAAVFRIDWEPSAIRTLRCPR